jgi:serine protease Do
MNTSAIRLALFILCAALPTALLRAQSVLDHAMERVVKIYGAGGLGRVEAYGTGLVVSPDGHVLTVLSPMLHGSPPRIIRANGQRYTARIVATDMARELAMLKFEAAELPHWEFEQSATQVMGNVLLGTAAPGERVYALSNLFGVAVADEPVSVQQGVLAAIAKLNPQTRGPDARGLTDEVYVLDVATSNPGAAGGAIVSDAGKLLGMIGKELQDTRTGVWINYAVPAASLQEFVRRAVSGESLPPSEQTGFAEGPGPELRAVDLRGIGTLPEVLDTTPPFVDSVEKGTPAASAGLVPDDLIMFVGEEQVRNLTELRLALSGFANDQPVPLTILRGEQLVTIELPARK